MSKKLRDLIDIIQKKDIVDKDYLDDDLISEIINMEDITTFHLILNYMEKININYSTFIMDRKKDNYNQLIKSFELDSGLFGRDKKLFSDINSYIEKVKSNRSVLNNKYNEIAATFKPKVDNYSKIESIIVSCLDSERSFDFIQSRLNDEKLLINNDIRIVEDFYNKYKEYYDLDSNMYSEEQEIVTNLLNSISKNYSEETCDIIKKCIKNGKIDLIQNAMNDYNLDLIKKIIVSYLFEDVPENFLKNLDNIITFQSKVDKDFIKPGMLKIYQIIISTFREGDLKQLVSLFNKLKEIKLDYKSEFYDSYTEARKTNAKLIMDSVYRVDDQHEEQGIIDGVKYYSLTGQPFYMMIHGSTSQITDFRNGPHDGTSMSLISGERLNVFNDGVIYGFDSLKPEQFIELYVKDTSTEFDIGSGKKSMLDAVPRYYTPQEFIENTSDNQYNEILYLSGNSSTQEIEPPRPSYIVCIDEINHDSIDIARKLNIPIVKIETKYYPAIRKNNMGHFAFLDEQDVYKTL